MKMLFVYQMMFSYVEKDLRILKSKYEVFPFQFKGLISIPSLFFAVLKCDITFSWFGKLHAFWAVFFSKLLGKKSAVIAGGDDVANEPEISYGLFSQPLKKWCPIFLFKNADLIIPVSKCTERELLINTHTNPKKVRQIYHGFNVDKLRRIESIKKQDVVITAGFVYFETTIKKKGLDLFVKSARFLPGVRFIFLGGGPEKVMKYLKINASDNVEFKGEANEDELIRFFNEAKVYVQVSRHESFGCSLAEAMLCECIPVVSNRTALPEVVGECGYYAEDLNPKNIADKIKEALSEQNDLGKKARERIKTHFSLEKRKIDLLQSIESLKT